MCDFICVNNFSDFLVYLLSCILKKRLLFIFVQNKIEFRYQDPALWCISFTWIIIIIYNQFYCYNFLFSRIFLLGIFNFGTQYNNIVYYIITYNILYLEIFYLSILLRWEVKLIGRLDYDLLYIRWINCVTFICVMTSSKSKRQGEFFNNARVDRLSNVIHECCYIPIRDIQSHRFSTTSRRHARYKRVILFFNSSAYFVKRSPVHGSLVSKTQLNRITLCRKT